MKKKLRVGIAGVCHVHVHNVALIFKRHPLVELVAVADTAPPTPEAADVPYTRGWNLDYLVNRVGIRKRHDDYRTMLEQEELDIVICNAENGAHPEVVEACGAAGAHVCVEKPMAASLADAQAMEASARRHGIALVIHWYMPFAPLQLRAKQLVDQGVVGEILQIHMRAAHAGPLAPGVVHPGPNIATAPMTHEQLAATWWYRAEAGGGAMIDFCSYGCAVSRWLLGQTATSVVGVRRNLNSPWSDTDDNGTIVASFPGALGVFEGSWTTRAPGGASGPVVYGSEATMVVDECSREPAVRVISPTGKETAYGQLAPRDELTDVAHAMIHHIETGEPLHPTLDPLFNLEATAMLDAGLRSAESGRAEPVVRVLQ